MTYPIGTPGKAWGAAEKAQWLAAQHQRRSYQYEVLDKYAALPDTFTQRFYGNLPYQNHHYPLYAFCTARWNDNLPSILITGGVHGYETSGVQGALRFLLNSANAWHDAFNFVIVPCVSPWGYETINRWGQYALDPNRSFHADGASPEANLLMPFLSEIDVDFTAHFDLHETTDSDNSEFRPALASRDGRLMHDWEIPDGFYTVANTANPQIDFQRAIIASVAKVTHIAPADINGKIIGAEVVSEGVICYDKKALYLCGGVTNAPYVTTTEVYPDSPKTSPENCIEAQIAAISGGLNYLSKRPV